MRKGSLLIFTILLTCAALAGGALAEYGYTSVSGLPMAADFTYSVVFDAEGRPQIVTDYPFATTGAMEMNLTFSKGDISEALVLNYRPASGATLVSGYNGMAFSECPTEAEAGEAIRNGEVTLDDEVYINTAHFGAAPDWFLIYSASRKSYISYSEKTRAQAFNAMGAGGTERTVFYQGGEISAAWMDKRTSDADLLINYNAYGEITDASVMKYSGGTAVYDYDPSTGLFGGRTLAELGFAEADLETEPLASLGSRTGTETAVSVPAAAEPAANTASPFVMAGSILTGMAIGLVLVTRFRRRWNRKKEQRAPQAAGAVPEKEAQNTRAAAETPEFPEPPKTMSSGR